jgi:hypothetical protein
MFLEIRQDRASGHFAVAVRANSELSAPLSRRSTEASAYGLVRRRARNENEILRQIDAYLERAPELIPFNST